MFYLDKNSFDLLVKSNYPWQGAIGINQAQNPIALTFLAFSWGRT